MGSTSSRPEQSIATDASLDVSSETMTVPGEYPNPETLTEPGVTLTTFTCFPNLPRELRNEIWKLTKVPRLVLLSIGERRTRAEGDPETVWYLKSPAPVALHICRESREEMIGKFQKWPSYLGARPTVMTYVDPVSDFIYLDESSELVLNESTGLIARQLARWPQAECLMNLAIFVEDGTKDSCEAKARFLEANGGSHFPGLETITFVYHGGPATPRELPFADGGDNNLCILYKLSYRAKFCILWDPWPKWIGSVKSFPYRVVSCEKMEEETVRDPLLHRNRQSLLWPSHRQICGGTCIPSTNRISMIR